MPKLIYTIPAVCVALAATVFVVNVYFLNRLGDQTSIGAAYATAQKLEIHIRRTAKHLKPNYVNRNPRFFGVRNKLLKNLKQASYENASLLWEISQWVSFVWLQTLLKGIFNK